MCWMCCNATPPIALNPFSEVETTQHCPAASFSASSINRVQEYFFSLKVSFAQLNDKPSSQFFPFGNQHNLSLFSWTGCKISFWFVHKEMGWESQRWIKCILFSCFLVVPATLNDVWGDSRNQSVDTAQFGGNCAQLFLAGLLLWCLSAGKRHQSSVILGPSQCVNWAVTSSQCLSSNYPENDFFRLLIKPFI